MARRKTPSKTRDGPGALVPVLRDAVKLVDRALDELGALTRKPRRPPKPRKHAARRAPRKS